ncbi:iron-sulfur cluster assembly ATPase protein SufC [Sporolactobacillus inulinus]|uniref:Iron-sulfur cluster assembly ATPase protein SufC n=1 Tax=Sporolactobacillus inulinus TaxID=2078 RepID=A0A4Y1ZH01_9BACL|nr:iron-sulfur cluster assembly ATPase protein SufC [Sporolactobacillus inulinus]
MTAPELKINDLHVSVEGKSIVKGFDLDMKGGEIHALMGPNGTGKSTVASALMGHPKYEVTSGQALLNEQNLLDMAVDERARAGMFLAMQYPSEVSGVSNADFLRTAINGRRGEGNEIPLMKFIKTLDKRMNMLEMDESFAERYVNEGFSGGEKNVTKFCS